MTRESLAASERSMRGVCAYRCADCFHEWSDIARPAGTRCPKCNLLSVAHIGIPVEATEQGAA